MAPGPHTLRDREPERDLRMSLDAKIAQSMEIIDTAIAQHGPSHMFGLYSGGNDSGCSAHILSRHPSFTRAVRIDTTIGIPESRDHALKVAQDFQWRLLEYTAPVSYRELVLRRGFPGPGAHSYMYINLKERCVDRLVREHKTRWNDRIGLVTGVRLSESVRRMGHVETIYRDGCQLWIAPIAYWDEDDKIEYMARYNIPRNPVTDKMCVSGECLCGAYARKEEMVDLEENYPATAAVIHDLEAEAAIAGVHCKWGTRPPGARKKPTMGGMLCSSCNQRNFDFMEAAA